MEPGRVLGIDPGDKRIGLAISDPSRTIASPLGVIEHQSREADARRILSIAREQAAVLIIVGCPEGREGEISHQGRKSQRLSAELSRLGELPVELWSEYGTTQAARDARVKMAVPRNKRSGHLDDLAATLILQSYLESQIEE